MISSEFVYSHVEKTRTLSKGWSTSISITTNRASATTETQRSATTGNDVQPQDSPSESASSREKSPVATVMNPQMSNFGRPVAGNFGRMEIAAMAATMPTGTLMKKMSRQSTYSTR